MKILGISGGFRQGYQDAAACLMINGALVAAVEEERFSRVKFSPGTLPFQAINAVLKIGNISFSNIDYIAFHGSTWGDEIQSKLENYFIQHFGSCPQILRFHHHDCHAASAFYASGFDSATVITFDNSGDGISLQIMKAERGVMKLVKRFARPDSLGLFYQAITQYCGFVKDSDEYKLMGLSSFGNRDAFDFSCLIDFKNDELTLNREFFHLPSPGSPSLHKDEMVFNNRFIEKIGRTRRLPGSEISTFYKDVAASAQHHFEKLLLEIARFYVSQIGIPHICLAGGGALNCAANQKLMEAEFVHDIFIQPAAGDAGIALGAAWLCGALHGTPPQQMHHAYWGPAFSSSDIQTILDLCGVQYQAVDDVASDAAKEISENKVIGWFQGAMEFGPRALGNRSILANPLNPQMQQIVNQKIKFRESFRPLCPSVLEEDFHLYFDAPKRELPFMTITCPVKQEMRKLITAVTHVDGTARVQTVNSAQNPRFYELLGALKKITSHGIALNTSFNLAHEPIVCNPRDALASFFSSGMDVLYLGDFKISK